MAVDPEMAAKMAPGFEPVPLARMLLRTIRSGMLATLQKDGAPFASLVSVATDIDGTPIILISGLSSHTRQLEQDQRCSLLLCQTGKGDALAHPRLTVSCRAQRTERDTMTGAQVRRRFINRNPKSALYADFGDFSFWRLVPHHCNLNGGFARAWDGPASEILIDKAHVDTFGALEENAVAHMNSDHADALALYATRLCGARNGPWRATGMDPEGLDLAFADNTARLVFPGMAPDAAALRKTLAEMAGKAREPM